MCPYQIANPHLDDAYDQLIKSLEVDPSNPILKKRANDLALEMRSRRIDLARLKAKDSQEYTERWEQCKTLLDYAQDRAYEFLKVEFSVNQQTHRISSN